MLRLVSFSLMLISLLAAPNVCAATEADDSYAATATRAGRFFHYREWASASALYSLLIEMKPQVADNYARSIVALGMIKQPDHQVSLTNLALASHIPLDSLFTNVRNISFEIGQTSLYEHYLLLIKQREPWQSRIVDRYLLDYYTFRRNADGMIEYARIMLAGLPDDRTFLSTLARGYLMRGEFALAVENFLKLLTIYPDDLDALLYLGNYYASVTPTQESTTKALVYLTRAHELFPTPYVDSLIAELRRRF